MHHYQYVLRSFWPRMRVHGCYSPHKIGGGVLGDCWKPEERGKAFALYSLAPLLGPVVGPVAGAWIADRSTWRWVFWSTSIVDGIVQILGVFFLQESKLRIFLLAIFV